MAQKPSLYAHSLHKMNIRGSAKKTVIPGSQTKWKFDLDTSKAMCKWRMRGCQGLWWLLLSLSCV